MNRTDLILRRLVRLPHPCQSLIAQIDLLDDGVRRLRADLRAKDIRRQLDLARVALDVPPMGVRAKLDQLLREFADHPEVLRNGGQEISPVEHNMTHLVECIIHIPHGLALHRKMVQERYGLLVGHEFQVELDVAVRMSKAFPTQPK